MRKKKTLYALFSTLLSLLVIYLSVGVPVVQYRCLSCIPGQSDGRLLVKVEMAEGGCKCGCAEKAAKSSCSCSAQCGTDKATAAEAKGTLSASDENSSDTADKDNSSNCAEVHIEKLSLPTLTTALTLDHIQIPVMELLYNSFQLTIPVSITEQRTPGQMNQRMHEWQSLRYLHLFCTWLI